LLHGAYCLGCCWLLFVILFPLGIMNIAAMAVITLVIFAEKTLPWGRAAGRAAAVALHRLRLCGRGSTPIPADIPPGPRHGHADGYADV
jgi:predicted metal-binding membrane protein